MSSPLSLSAYYDRLMGPQGEAAWSGEHPDEWDAVIEGSQVSERHGQLFDAVDAFRLGETTVKPARPTEGTPGLVASPSAPPPSTPAGFEDLSEEDQASVRASRDPQARLQSIRARQALDDQVGLEPVLRAHGARATPGNPSRWTFPDGTMAMVKFDRKVWVEQGTLKVGQGATALWRRLTGADELAATTGVASLLSSGSPSPVVSNAPPSPVPAAEPPRHRFVRRPV